MKLIRRAFAAALSLITWFSVVWSVGSHVLSDLLIIHSILLPALMVLSLFSALLMMVKLDASMAHGPARKTLIITLIHVAILCLAHL